MPTIFQQFVASLTKPKYYLLSANVFLVFLLILLGNLRVVPLRIGDFLFFAIIVLAFALYRPGWAFLFFVGMIPLENINLAPENLGIAIRPYQFIGALAVAALLVRFFSKRLYFKLAKLNLADYLVIILVAVGFITAIVASIETTISLKLSVIFTSFAILYFLTRNYIQNLEDLKKVLPFFLSSATIVIFYGIWQNIAYLNNRGGFEVMPGRPNATFTEADWLGFFLVILLSAIYASSYYYAVIARERSDRGNPEPMGNISRLRQGLPACPVGRLCYARNDILLCFLLTSCFILLILTVSRSAWLGALASLMAFIWIFFTGLKFKDWRWKETAYLKLKIFALILISLAIVHVFHLTNFQLFNRAASTGGLQKITVACEDNMNLPESINNVSDLKNFDCRHINLEDIEKEKAAGSYVAEIYRKDPNVSIRSEIYQKSVAEIKNHPILGIGWGSIGKILGTDERGAALNSSNIFLEIWLGAGIVGLLAFITLLGYILFNSVKNYYYSENHSSKAFNLFIISSWFGLVIFNLFNAGIFLGFLWVWFGIAQIRE